MNIYSLCDLTAAYVSQKKASDFLKKDSLRNVDDIFLKKEGEKTYLYIVRIDSDNCTFPTEMLREFMSSPECTQRKKLVDDQSNEQDDNSALCLTENSTADTQPTQHCLSCVVGSTVFVNDRQEMENLIDVLSYVTSPRYINIDVSRANATDPVLVDTLVSRINFTNNIYNLHLTISN